MFNCFLLCFLFYSLLVFFRSSIFYMPSPKFSVNLPLADDNTTYKLFAGCEVALHTFMWLESFWPHKALSYSNPILQVKKLSCGTCMGHLARKWKSWSKGRQSGFRAPALSQKAPLLCLILTSVHLYGERPEKSRFKETDNNRTWWHTPLVPALWRQRQAHL